MKEKDKRKLIRDILITIITIILIVIFIFLAKNAYEKLVCCKNFESSIISFSKNNEKKIFSIDKVVLFSSSDSKNKSSSATNFTIENLYSFTDIALFINNNSEENTLENTLKSVKINNIKFTKEPLLGTSSLYYKNLDNFAKGEIIEENKINESLDFEITQEDKANLSRPVLYNNCANPITLSYINQNIKTDYTITDTENPITYNGSLLKRCGVSLASIDASVSFDIEIENNKNQKFRTTVSLNIPYEDGEKSIYDGNLTVKKNTNFDFYRYE